MKKLILVAGFLMGISLSAHAQEGEAEPPYGMSHLEAYSLFYENYRTGDYEMALTFGEWMLEAKPREIQGHRGFSLDNQFRRFITVYTGLAEEETDPSERARLYEKALSMFDLIRETFDEEEIDVFDLTMRQGTFYHENHRNLEGGVQKAFEFYERAFELDPQRYTERGDGFYARVLLESYVTGGEREKGLAMIEEIEPYASSGLAASIEEARNQIFDDPAERVVFLEERLDEAEDRELVLTELAELYDELGDRTKARETVERLYELNPSFENTRKLADMALSDAEYGSAVEYLMEAMEKSPDASQQARLAREISDVYQNMDDLQTAREYARRAIDLDSSYGDAYVRMASVYAAAISECTRGRSMDRDDRTVYWLVLDYLDRAKEVDRSVTSAVNRQIESYEAVMPTTEDKFFRGWETGESFDIDGSLGECYAWINETTTVR